MVEERKQIKIQVTFMFSGLYELLFSLLFARIAVGGGASCLTMDEEVQVVQLNMNRSNLAAVALNERLKTLKSKYIYVF